MANIIKIKRSSIPGKIPLVGDLDLGEFAINTYDGKIFIKKNVSGTESIVEIGAFGYTGSRGYTGSQGVTGFVGSKGDLGFTGSQGVTGFTGSKGDTGYTGSQGIPGLSSGAVLYLDSTNVTQTVPFTATNKTLRLIPDVSARQLIISNSVNNSATRLVNFVTQPGDLLTTTVNPGIWTMNLYAYVNSTSGGRTVSYWFNVDEMASDGTTVLGSIYAGSIASGTLIDTTAQDIHINQSYVQTYQLANLNSRIRISIFAETSSGTRDITIEVRDSSLSNVVTTIASNLVGYVGSQGDRGYTGSQGTTGFAGSQGALGYTGSIGFTGSQGVIGYSGSLGFTGSIGFTGSQGNTGFTGSHGFTGSQGVQGIQGEVGYDGSRGYTGSIGFTGSQGVIGFTGSQGTQGSLGYTGSQGVQGDIGYTGSHGFAGSQGTTGFTGSQGTQGTQGFTGSQGTQGTQGFTGSQGTQGIQGEVGYTGSIGYTGSHGFTGSQGDIGYTGSHGFTGSQGNIGYTGSIGFTGSKGDIGYTGSEGIQGEVGYDGSRGYTGSIGFTGSKGDTGLGFNIAKSYISVAALVADTTPTGIVAGQFAIIETGNVEDTENSRLYLWNGSAYSYVTDLSGAQGIRGFTGSQGNIGFTGSQGSQGVIGNTGFTGSQGIQGVNGYTGSQGVQGVQGEIGYTGSLGYTGSIGFTGSQGVQGATGFTGSLGFTGSIGYTGSGLSSWIYITATTTLATFGRYAIDTTSGPYTVSLPASPSSGDWLIITDASDWGVNNLTIARNGSTIEGLAQNLLLNMGNVNVEFVYVNSTWQVVTTMGVQGDIGYTGSIGFTGSQGVQGVTGFTGSQGIQGTPGEFGYTGSRGVTGFTGSIGGLGYTGSVGGTVINTNITPSIASPYDVTTADVNERLLMNSTSTGVVRFLSSNTTGMANGTVVEVAAMGALTYLHSNGVNDLSISATGTNNTVFATLVQADGKIVIAGTFTTVAGTTRNRIARFNSDGSLDTGFDPNVQGGSGLNVISQQSDGKLLIGGSFTTVGGTTRANLARLNTDGTLDTGWSANTFDNEVSSIGILSTGKVVVGGNFTTISANTRVGIALFDSNGTLNAATADTNSTVDGIAIQSDDKIILVGNFTTVGGTTRNRIARLTSAFVLESYDPNAGARVQSVILQSDGKAIIAGNFTTVGGTTRTRIARINTDGTLDTTGWTTTGGSAANIARNALGLQSDGKILVVGGWTTAFNGFNILYAVRLNTDGTVDPSFNANFNASNNCVAVGSNNAVIIGGTFSTVHGQSQVRIVRLVGTNADTIYFPYATAPVITQYGIVRLEKLASAQWLVTSSTIS
jgi:uncharacterized delta-60 repeat protein